MKKIFVLFMLKESGIVSFGVVYFVVQRYDCEIEVCYMCDEFYVVYLYVIEFVVVFLDKMFQKIEEMKKE